MSFVPNQSHSAIGGVVLIASCLTSLYLFRQNRVLRTKLQEQGAAKEEHTCLNDENENENDAPSSGRASFFVMEEIGIIQSPFPQRAGCPRQGGTLAPHVKSRLVLHPHISNQALDGIVDYSHVWIIFSFHLNSRGKARQTANNTNGNNRSKFSSTKIRPPRANGRKVGVLATRAPHRPNPVGLSLALLEGVVVQPGNGNKKQTCMVLRGFDLVDGTPVYDVKPFVPWDRIDAEVPLGTTSMSTAGGLQVQMKQLRVPSWVAADDTLSQVQWSQSARDQLYEVRNSLKPLYDATTDAGSVEEACLAIEEIIAQDPRAMRDGRGRSSTETFEFTFASLRIQFTIDAEAMVATISNVVVDQGDLTSSVGSYPYNLALRCVAEREAHANGTKIEWANPVREGVTRGLFDLRGGGVWTMKVSAVSK